MCILGKSIWSALTDSIPIVECRNAERPFVKLKAGGERERERQRTGKQGTAEHFALPHRLLNTSSCHFKGIVEEPKQNTCVETHMPVVKCIPHEYKFSKQTTDKSKRLCQKCFFLWLVTLWRCQQLKCVMSKCTMINELWIGKDFERNNRGLIDVLPWYYSVGNELGCKKNASIKIAYARDPDSNQVPLQYCSRLSRQPVRWLMYGFVSKVCWGLSTISFWLKNRASWASSASISKYKHESYTALSTRHT
jgi:hypothetical protein